MPTIYDAVPYPDLSFSQTHPDRLAVIAALFGVEAIPADQCRVLELGCASGGNLIPMAYGLPNSHFVGVDLSTRQIESAQQMADTLHLQNITFKAMDILNVDSNFGQFDYIIAHGVYSWVPPAVSEKVLTLCEQLLAASGVCFISYNTYPGWHMVSAVREMLLYHTRTEADTLTRIAEAKDFLNFLADAAPPENSELYTAFTGGYHTLLQKQRRYLTTKEDALLLHDELGEINRPVYFHQFIEQAERHNLQYLAEAALLLMRLDDFPPPVIEYLSQTVHSLVELEQHLDFLRNQTFRQTLLCRRDVRVDRTIKAEHFGGLFIGCRAEPINNSSTESGRLVAQFRGGDGIIFATDHPVTQSAFHYLIEIAPRCITFDDLIIEARKRVYTTPETMADNAAYDAHQLAISLFDAFTLSTQIIELHSYAPHWKDTISERPTASPIARYQAQHGKSLTNLRHEHIEIDANALHLRLLPYLDGTRDRAALLEIMLNWAESGKISIRDDDGSLLADRGKIRGVLDLNLDAVLYWMARHGLLEA